MKSRKIINIITIIFILNTSLFCKKEAKHYSIPEDFKQCCLFKKGSYWTYIEDSLKILDSTFIINSPSYAIVKTGEGKYDPTIEQYNISFISKILLYQTIRGSLKGHDDLFIALNDSAFSIGLVYNLPNNIKYEYYGAPTNGYITKIKLYDSVEINGKSYYDILQTVYKGENYIYPYIFDSINFYYAKNLGLIKITGEWNSHKHSWSIVRIHAIR